MRCLRGIEGSRSAELSCDFEREIMEVRYNDFRGPGNFKPRHDQCADGACALHQNFPAFYIARTVDGMECD